MCHEKTCHYVWGVNWMIVNIVNKIPIYIYIYIYIYTGWSGSICSPDGYNTESRYTDTFDQPVVDYVESKKKFIGKLKNLLIDQSFYSVNKFLNYSYEPQGNHYVQ